MTLVMGRGKNRRVHQIPCSHIVNRGSEHDQVLLHANLCELLKVPIG